MDKKLIIWVCNRFDYCDGATANGKFPDPGYYKLIEEATNKENVYFIGYTQFELIYAPGYQKAIKTYKKHQIKLGLNDYED